jgi:hypothetical protein
MTRFRDEYNISTGETTQVPYTAEEEAAADAYVAPTPQQIDEENLTSRLAIPGSVERAILKVMFAHENRIRVLESQPPITLNQFKTQIRTLMRNGS